MSATAESPPVVVYQFHVLLLEISPAIWRRVLVRSDNTVADLHYILQLLMGWEDEHLHRFRLHGREYGLYKPGGIGFTDNPYQVRLHDWHLRPNERFLYEYNFHANWQHQLRLEQILPLPATGRYPRCIGGARQAPSEDCGGAAAFLTRQRRYSIWYIEQRLLEIAESLLEHDGDNDEEQLGDLHELRYWATWERFDRRAINRQLQEYAVAAATKPDLSEEERDEADHTGDT